MYHVQTAYLGIDSAWLGGDTSVSKRPNTIQCMYVCRKGWRASIHIVHVTIGI